MPHSPLLPRVALAGCALLAPWSAASAADLKEASYYNRPALVLSNDRVELTVLPLGGAFTSLLLKGDAERMNPMWDSLRDDRESGRPERAAGSIGHFVCVDGFGPVSPEERAAGLPGHGEAHSLPWVTRSSTSGREAVLVQTVHLPRVQEVFTRTIRLTDGENVVHVRSELESLLHFDRPACWAEHGTIGSPFLEPGVTVVDIAPSQAMTRPYEARSGGRPHRLASGKEFTWPMAPTADGGRVDLRAAPVPHDSGDHTGHRYDPGRKHAWVTALHPGKRLLLGYIFNREEFPWLQTWESYPAKGMLARGLEFGSQAFDLPRRQVVTENRIFGELLYRWLPARSKIEGAYLMFWTPTPEGFRGVDEVRLEGGRLIIEDRKAGKTVTLRTSHGL